MDQQALQESPGTAISRLSPGAAYDRIVGALEQYKGSTIAVPELSHLLGVKTTTLNARFRREHLPVNTLGRTNYIPCELALRLAERHKYALCGWPTLREASRVTAMKQATIKARCEKGQLEGYLDLTKRLRINPSELEKLLWPRSQATPRNGFRGPPVVLTKPSLVETKTTAHRPVRRYPEWTPPAPRPFPLSAAPQPEVAFITERDYGLPEVTTQVVPPNGTTKRAGSKSKQPGCLCYDPDRPLSVSQCSVGKAIRYGHYEGRILKIIDDPFNPRIQVRFPGHDLPVMREVCLIVNKRKQ